MHEIDVGLVHKIDAREMSMAVRENNEAGRGWRWCRDRTTTVLEIGRDNDEAEIGCRRREDDEKRGYLWSLV